MKNFLIRTFAVLAFLIVALVIFVFVAWDKNFEAPFPDIKASTDSSVIARGKYLAYGPSHCSQCHSPADKFEELDKGAEIPLIGGFEFDIPPGKLRTPNLTPDMETGIGKLSDGQIARAMRYSVNHNNKAMFPFMPFQEMSDEDVTAIISFLRSQPAVKHQVEPNEYSFLGKALLALGAIKPVSPKNIPPKSVSIDTTVLYGEYVANRVANCVGCHTNRDLKTGVAIGEPFAGGLVMPADKVSLFKTFVSPNLTPDSETGVMTDWNEKIFISRFKAGRVHKGSHMPWGMFSRMNDVELKALYRYLHTLKPIKNSIPKTVYEKGEALPE